MPRKLTTEEFIQRSVAVHGNKYGYGSVEYKSSVDKVAIVCPEHGLFWQAAISHIRGRGCPSCYRPPVTTESYLERAKVVWGDRYDLSGVVYSGSRGKIKVGCEKHGEFYIQADNFLAGHGCPKCGFENSASAKKPTTEEFIIASRAVHGDKYDYSRVVYVGNKFPVDIICRKHGVFSQRPNDHLFGKGCPFCKESHGEQLIAGFLTKNDVPFVREKKFKDCMNHKALPFDFFVPKLNTCIEFQGKQHYENVGMFDKEDSLEERQLRDQIKRDYCASHGIRLVEIRYDQDIEEELKKQLQL